MSRRFEHKRQQWARQEVMNKALADLAREQRIAKIKFFLIFIPLLFLAIAGMFYLAMIAPGFIMGV